MKLGSLKEGGRDGTLVVVARDLGSAVRVPHIAPTLQSAIEAWQAVAPELEAVARGLDAGRRDDAFALDPAALASPLPRAYQWVDASAYLNHVELVRRARGAKMPASFLDDPLMYQGGSDAFIGPCDPILAASEDWGIDLEGEVAAILDDVPMGAMPAEAGRHVKLLMLVNDVSLRGLIPAELAKGFGFFQGKPATAFSPVAVTPDELGAAWDGAKVNLPLIVRLNGKQVGRANAGVDMQFDFPRLIAHAARTRVLTAGTILGSGTISNRDRAAGWSCIAEVRMIETIERGAPITPFMKFGDRVRIEMLDQAGMSIFGAIDQVVERYRGPGED